MNGEANSGKGVLIAVFIAVSIVYVALFFQFQRHPVTGALSGASDFSCIYWVGKVALSHDRLRIYDLALQASYDASLDAELAPGNHFTRHRFIFPPFVLLLYAPLALLSYAHAVAVWYALNVALLLSFPFLLRGVLQLGNRSLALALLITPLFLPVLNQLGQGQMSILLLLIFTLTYRYLAQSMDLRAGSMLALATFKPQFVLLLLLVLVLTRNWKALQGFTATCGGLLAVSVGLVGWRATLGYPQAMLQFSHLPAKLGGEVPEVMFNLRGFIVDTFGSHLSGRELHSVILLASAALLSLALIPFVRRQPRISAMGFSLIVTVTLLASYHAYVHDMTLLLLPFLLLASYIAETDLTPLRLAMALTGGSLFIITSIYPPWFPICLLLFSVTLFLETLRINTSDLPVKIKELRPACVAGATR